MAEQKVQDRQNHQELAEQPKSRGEVVATAPGSMKLRLPYPKALGEAAGIDHRTWQVLTDAVWPSAKTTEAVCLAISYCKSRNLDPLKRPIHIVPVWSKTGGLNGTGGEVETIWPGISELRTTAVRTGVYAGKDAAVFGPDITKNFQHVDDRSGEVKDQLEVTFPEWCQVTVYRMVQGQRCAFVGPKVYWLESYASKSKFSEVPNEMWADRRSGQLEKCAEAASLRAAFPEELGNEYTAEEMYGKTIEGAPANSVRSSLPGEVVPPRPRRSDFERPAVVDVEPEPEPSPEPDPEDNLPEALREPKTTPREQARPQEAKSSPAPTAADKPKAPTEPPKEDASTETKVEPQISAEADARAERERVEFNSWYEDQKSELGLIKRVSDVADLRDMVAEQLQGDPRAKEWDVLCSERISAILEATRKPKK